MQELIAQFVKLPLHVRAAVSSPQSIEKLEKIEKHYNVHLADLVMRVVTKQLAMTDLQTYCQSTFSLSKEASRELTKDIMQQIFANLASYLDFNPNAEPENPELISPAHQSSLGVEYKDADIVKHERALKYESREEWYDAKKLADSLIAQFTLSFAGDVQTKRFEHIIESRLVDARSKQETLDRLTRDSKIGGCGLPRAVADQIMAKVEFEFSRIHTHNIKVKTQEPVVTRTAKPQAPSYQGAHPVQPKFFPPAQPVTSATKPPVTQPQQPTEKKEDISVPQWTPKFMAQPRPTPPPVSTPPVQPPPQPKQEPPKMPYDSVPHFMPRVYRTLDVDTNRPTVADIRPARKLVGPIEELQQMTMDDFRKLGQTGEESAERIKEKIRILEKESFEKRSQGVRAWRMCPIMKEYLAVGNESMEKNLSVTQTLQRRTQEGRGSMTPDEFDLISSLNSSLRY